MASASFWKPDTYPVHVNEKDTLPNNTIHTAPNVEITIENRTGKLFVYNLVVKLETSFFQFVCVFIYVGVFYLL